MTEQASHGNGQGAAPRHDPGLPSDIPDVPGRDSHLTGFGNGGEWDTCPPSAALVLALEQASGPGWRCSGASRDEMLGLLRQWQALESRAVAGKLGVLRALIRDDDRPLPGGGYHGDLPEGWTKSLTHEVAVALSMPAVSADRLMWLAWDLEGRLPGVGGLLADGALTLSKAKAVNEALQQLTSEDAATAEALILPALPGKTFGQAVKLAAQVAVTVDPESAARRREDAERTKSRVTMFREESGAAALSGRDMPTGQTLTAHASVCARAQEYEESGAFPDDTRMDQYRVVAYLDLLNGITAAARIASGLLPGDGTDADITSGCNDRTGGTPSSATGTPVPEDKPLAGKPWPDGRDCSCHECDGGCLPPEDDPAEDEPTDGLSEDQEIPPDDEQHGDDPDDGMPGDAGSRGPRHGGPGTGGSQPDSSPAPDADHGSDRSRSPSRDCPEGKHDVRSSPAAAATTARPTDLVLPLTTLLGLAERPGEGHRLGPLDPALCRELAITAASSPDSRLCVTVTDPDGIAIGHGCARTDRHRKRTPGVGHISPADHVCPGSLVLPARLNLTITAGHLAELARTTGPPGRACWAFTPDTDSEPPGGYGIWTLTLPDGRNLSVEPRPVPTFECDHRYESHAYQPNDALRHLIQIRDGECTFPPCSRHAKESDFEHATPYDKGGRTCACNAGARSRACHQVKQSPGWTVTQPKPGWHQWETPSGRTYLQGPKHYPA